MIFADYTNAEPPASQMFHKQPITSTSMLVPVCLPDQQTICYHPKWYRVSTVYWYGYFGNRN